MWPRGGGPSCSGPPRAVTLLARALLVSAATMSACLPPDFEIAPENRDFSVDLKKVDPPLPLAYATRACPQAAIEFKVAGAVSDPDGDPMTVSWWVDFEDQPVFPNEAGALEETTFSFDPCDPTWLAKEEIVFVEAVLLDRPARGFTGADARTPIEGGNEETIVWAVDIKGSTAVCCE